MNPCDGWTSTCTEPDRCKGRRPGRIRRPGNEQEQSRTERIRPSCTALRWGAGPNRSGTSAGIAPDSSVAEPVDWQQVDESDPPASDAGRPGRATAATSSRRCVTCRQLPDLFKRKKYLAKCQPFPHLWRPFIVVCIADLAQLVATPAVLKIETWVT